MFKRFSLHVALVCLFVFAQIGAAAHEISHYSNATKHSQQDKNTATEQCGQCMAYAQVASGLHTQAFVLPTFDAHFGTEPYYYFNALTTRTTAYTARAPPQSFSI